MNYYESTNAHNIAVSAGSKPCLRFAFLEQLRYDDVSFGQFNGSFPLPGGTTGGTYTITTQMQTGIYGVRNVLITSVGQCTGFRGYTIIDTVKVLLSPYKFSVYAMFDSTDNSVNWTTGDTLTGPFQTNGNMYVTGVPVIKGPVSIGGTLYNSKSTAYNGTNTSTWEKYGDTLKANSFRSGVTVPMPSNGVAQAAAPATAATTFSPPSGDTTSSYAYDVYLTFNSNGTVTATDTTRQYSSGHGGGWTTAATNSSPLTSSGLTLSSLTNPLTGGTTILVNNGNVHVQGVVNGDVTLVAQSGKGISYESVINSPSNTSSGSNGNVLIDGNITYNTNPQTAYSTDMLGLVATNGAMLVTQPSGNVAIDAAIFARNGSFSYQGYTSSQGSTSNGAYNTFNGYIQLYGSISQKTRGPVGQVSGTGYLKNYKYDSRFTQKSPPGFPGTNRYKVLAWRE